MNITRNINNKFGLKKKWLGIAAFCIVSFVLISCSKSSSSNVNCSNAQLCIVNHHGKVIHYSWNVQGVYLDSIMPNGTVCTSVGQVTVNSTTTQTPTVWFYSDDGNYQITVNQCSVTQAIN
jgi:hypothetical protein